MITRKLIANAMIIVIALSLALQMSGFVGTVTKRSSMTVYGAGGVPISGAMVTAVGTNGSGYTTTSANGQFSITQGLKTGTDYTVTAQKDGYLYGNVSNVAATVGSVTPGISLYLNLSGGITGKITDSNTSLPVANVPVVAMPSSGGVSIVAVGISDASGNYRINMNLATGSYNVTATLIGYTGAIAYSGKTVGPIAVTAGNVTEGINIALDRSGTISGRITTPSGQGISNATVTATTIGGGLSGGFATTNATGYYRVTSGLSSGNYMVVAVSGSAVNTTMLVPSLNPVVVVAGQETSNVNLQLTVTPPPASGIISGRVTDANSGNPVSGASVTATGSGTGSSGSATTDANGNYTISSGLATDSYTVAVSNAKGYQTANQTGISVQINQVTSNVNFALQLIPASQSGTISGSVSGDINPIPEFEYPIAAMFIITLVAAIILKASSRKTRYARLLK
jgi:hypothetical protein